MGGMRGNPWKSFLCSTPAREVQASDHLKNNMQIKNRAKQGKSETHKLDETTTLWSSDETG